MASQGVLNPEEFMKNAAAQGMGMDLFQRAGIDYKTWALISCEMLVKYIDGDGIKVQAEPKLAILKPWISRLTVTSYLDAKEARIAKLRLRSQVIRIKLTLDEDAVELHIKLEVIESIIQMLISSDIEGWRGRILAENTTHVDWSGQGQQNIRKKRFWIF